jgi:NitT/TauT family transport system ATP-binding protein
MTLLSVSKLRKSFEGLLVLSDLDLEVEPGEFVSLIGPSGCGKSTLFDLLTGSVSPDEGAITWKGAPVEDLSSLAAWMSQSDLLLPWLTLRENAMLPIRHPTGKDKKRGDSLLKRLGLRGFENYLPGKVSGGMRQRCALARTILFDRELILLDEPLSALDALTRQGLQGMLVTLQKEFGKTIVMITHDVEEALVTSDRLVTLSQAPMKITGNYSLQGYKPRHRDDPYVVKLRGAIMDVLQGRAS